MRDMTDDGRNETHLSPHHIPSFQPVPEKAATTTISPSHHHRQQTRSHSVSKPVHPHHHSQQHHQQQRTLTDKRSRSSTVLTTPPSVSSCQVKNASTSNLGSCRSPKQRSVSGTTRPATSLQPTRRTTPVHGGLTEHQRTSAASQHKH